MCANFCLFTIPSTIVYSSCLQSIYIILNIMCDGTGLPSIQRIICDFLVFENPRGRWTHKSPLKTISSDYLLIVGINNVCTCVQLYLCIAECVHSWMYILCVHSRAYTVVCIQYMRIVEVCIAVCVYIAVYVYAVVCVCMYTVVWVCSYVYM